ncbi:hypothetical protein ARMGADRAFT_1032125 [Armillaria gallica]|uniref:Uncharacterized protein n=1 Tax=Armillaria gallica TaxID=47427 RepID=A0A2H3DUC7_ARMGA|nr:hypothetical protein ARMGADRAFT_1032125 [Armillaria gallica]
MHYVASYDSEVDIYQGCGSQHILFTLNLGNSGWATILRESNINDQGTEGDTDVNIEILESGGIPTDHCLDSNICLDWTSLYNDQHPYSHSYGIDLHVLGTTVQGYNGTLSSWSTFRKSLPFVSAYLTSQNVKLGWEDDVGEDVIGELYTTPMAFPVSTNLLIAM